LEEPRDRLDSPGYQVFMLVLCLFALGALAAQTAIRLEPQTRGILAYADYAVCAVFFVDFVISLWRAPDRRRYLVTWGWLDLLSSIPTVDVARWGRAARVLRVFRVLRGLRATRLLATLVLRKRAQNTALAVSLIALLLVVFCSIAVLHVETEADSNIKTAEDAIWWAFATITTVGYGDRYPVTSEGRLIAAILMCAGVGLFGTFSGYLAAWFMGPQATSDEPDVKAELVALRQELAAIRIGLASARQGPREGDGA
jgi:voltage-gated potassium channel